MGLFELIDLMSSRDGDELLEKLANILCPLGIATTDDNGNFKDIHTLCCEIVKVLNQEK